MEQTYPPHGPVALDCAATMFALGRTVKRPSLIRLTAYLNESVKPYLLQAALESTARAYPYFFAVFFSQGNDLLLRPAENLPPVREKRRFTCIAPDHSAAGCEAWVQYAGNAVYLEYFHGISDGKGGLTVLLHLIAQYCALRYHDRRFLAEFSVPSLREQLQNGYRRWARGLATDPGRGTAYRIRGTPGQVCLTRYTLSAELVRARARQCGATVTEYLAALLGLALLRCQREDPRTRREKPVRLTVPVDLRARLASKTVRNFSLNVCLPLLPAQLGRDLPHLCGTLHQALQTATTPRRLAGRCGTAQAAANFPLLHWLPLSFKRRIVQGALELPSAGSTLTFSNLGAVSLSPALQGCVASLEATFLPKPGAPYTCTVITAGDDLRMTLLRTTRQAILEPQLEALFGAQNLMYWTKPQP